MLVSMVATSMASSFILLATSMALVDRHYVTLAVLQIGSLGCQLRKIYRRGEPLVVQRLLLRGCAWKSILRLFKGDSSRTSIQFLLRLLLQLMLLLLRNVKLLLIIIFFLLLFPNCCIFD